jgi:hypothetical protein
MAPDDRERVFEKALARHLRSNVPGEQHPSLSACPDAEILAAYHDRLLGPGEMLTPKEHIVGCSRCQQILAQLEATDELPVGLHVEEDQASGKNRETQKVLAMATPALAEDPSETPRQSVPAAPRSRAAARWARHLKAHPGAKWGWLAPAGLVAAGLLVWIGTHESNPTTLQVAKNQQQPATLQSNEPASSATRTAREPAQKRLQDERAPAAPPPSRQDFDGAAPAKRDETATLDRKAAPAAEADKLTGSRPEVSSEDANALKYDDANKSEVADASGAQDGAREKELKKQAAAGAPAPLPAAEEGENNSITALSETAPVAQAPAAPASAKVRAVGAGTGHQQQNQQQQIGGVAGATVTSQSEVVELRANVRSSVVITAPDPPVLWRASRDGIIQHSTDSGSTWAVQPSGVVADLLAGSAPSDQVCWIVGRAGTIVRTTDGGQNWHKVPSPVPGDVTSVFAVDAQQATVTAAYTGKSYKTMDGGQTWTVLSNP